MTTLMDLAERKRSLEEAVARAQRKLGILRQIEELAAQLDDEELTVPPVRIPVQRPESDFDPDDPEPEPPEPEPPEAPANGDGAHHHDKIIDTRERAPTAPRVRGRAKKAGPEQCAKVYEALADGPLLQKDITAKTGLNSGGVWRATKQLEAEGKIRQIGKGGYLDRSPMWQRCDQANPKVQAPPKATPGEARMERQEASLEGRIMEALRLQPLSAAELAQRTRIPMSTISNRILPALMNEGEVVGVGKGRWRVRGA